MNIQFLLADNVCYRGSGFSLSLHLFFVLPSLTESCKINITESLSTSHKIFPNDIVSQESVHFLKDWVTMGMISTVTEMVHPIKITMTNTE